jgi:hypothetical protein
LSSEAVLPAIDTATELAAYYPIQVEKTLERCEQLLSESGPMLSPQHSPKKKMTS